MKNYTIFIIIVLCFIIIFGYLRMTTLKHKIAIQEQTIISQDAKLKEQLTEINLKTRDLEAKEQAILALKNLNSELNYNNSVLKDNLKALEEIESKDTIITKEVKIVDPLAGSKYINLRNDLIRRLQ